MNLLEAKPYVEMFAYLAAGIFFLYKLLTGYMMTNLSIALTTSRQHSTPTEDYLVVSVALTKGDRGTVNLHDCQVKISCSGHCVTKQLIGTDRRDKKTEHFHGSDRSMIIWDARSVRQPFLNLTPGETSQFATHLEVPANAICEIELAVLAMKVTGFRVGQWRASAISLPIDDSSLRSQKAE